MNIFRNWRSWPRSRLRAPPPSAQTVKIGFITSYSGLNGNLGPYMERAVRLYLKQHEKELGGVKVELHHARRHRPQPRQGAASSRRSWWCATR